MPISPTIFRPATIFVTHKTALKSWKASGMIDMHRGTELPELFSQVPLAVEQNVNRGNALFKKNETPAVLFHRKNTNNPCCLQSRYLKVNSPDPVHRSHDRFVVFDDEHGVAPSLQVTQGFDEPLVVSRVQADGRLVEYEQTPTSPAPRPAARRTRGVAATERVGRAIESQVVEPHLIEEPESCGDLGDDRFCDREFILAEFEGFEPLLGRPYRERRDFEDCPRGMRTALASGRSLAPWHSAHTSSARNGSSMWPVASLPGS